MQTPSPQKMLRVWEEGQSCPPWARALLLLEAAAPGTDRAVLTRLPVGERDARLVELRAGLFGETLSSLAECPACGERLELTFSIADLRLPAPTASAPYRFQRGAVAACFRLPDSADFEALPVGPQAPRVLLEACVSDVTCDGAPAALGDLTEADIAALVAQMAETDPRADLKAAMTCPHCRHAWSARFDIVGFLWEELGAWVRRLLAEVHVLARSYGWHEDDVLALSPWRRRYYIGLVRS